MNSQATRPAPRIALAPWPGVAHGLVGQVRDGFDRLGIETFTLNASVSYLDTFDAIVLSDPPRMSGPWWSELIARTLSRGAVVAALSGATDSLSAAGALGSRTVTGCDESRRIVETEGGHWSDRVVCRDGSLVTAQGPAYVEAFCAEVCQSVGAFAPDRGDEDVSEDRLDEALAQSFPASDTPQQLRGVSPGGGPSSFR